jgi:hypothetical protein
MPLTANHRHHFISIKFHAPTASQCTSPSFWHSRAVFRLKVRALSPAPPPWAPWPPSSGSRGQRVPSSLLCTSIMF